MVKPVTKGRQKTEMKKIKNKRSLGISFTKRRSGLFKKANELVTLCGTALALSIFSPGKEAYSFGHPDVCTILNRFLQEILNNQPQNSTFGGKHFGKYKERNIDVGNIYTQCNEIPKHAEVERRKAKEPKKQIREQGCTMEMPPKEELSLPQALELRAMVQELKAKISSKIDKRFVAESSTINVGSSSNKFIGEEQVDFMFNLLDASRTSDIRSLSNYGPWNI